MTATTTTAALEHSDASTAVISKQKVGYIGALVVSFWMMEAVTDRSVFQIIEHHEPSIRIFRALLEGVLLLTCASVSLAVFLKYLGHEITEQLLFHPAFQALDDNTSLEREEDCRVVHKDTLFEASSGNDFHNDRGIELCEILPKSGARPHDKQPSATAQYDEPIDCKFSNLPSPMDLLNAALDALVYILMALFLYAFTALHASLSPEPSKQNEVARLISRIAAPTFPLLLFAYAVFKIVHPWQNRRLLFQIISFTLSAPFLEVTFRDGMIGDILTSMVRPMQDIAFTVFYILFGFRQWWSNAYFFPNEPSQTERQFITNEEIEALSSSGKITFIDAADASVPAMERSWIVHTVVLPACMISPLWWRFLQNMRQTYDSKRRWPYLANALKYFVAAQVAMVGVYHPQVKQNPLWLFSFVVATLYQVWYDVFLDWNLLVRNSRTGRWDLRTRRLYPSKSFYWIIAVVNLLLRFCWTLSFVPLKYLSEAGVLRDTFDSAVWSNILGPFLASAEIVRRALWGLLRVEWEAIKEGDDSNIENEADDDRNEERTMKPMIGGGSSALGRWGIPLFSSDMSSMDNIQILAELCCYSTIFAVLGLIAAAHRNTQ